MRHLTTAIKEKRNAFSISTLLFSTYVCAIQYQLIFDTIITLGLVERLCQLGDGLPPFFDCSAFLLMNPTMANSRSEAKIKVIPLKSKEL